jgi:hypothetical protein
MIRRYKPLRRKSGRAHRPTAKASKSRRRSASAYPALGIPKGRTRAAIKRAKDDRAAVVIHAVYEHVSQRDGGCRFTGWTPAEMNEIVSRAKTRGMRPERRFNGANCIMLHPLVHRCFTAGVLGIVAEDVDAGADGTVLFEVRDDASPLWHALLDETIRRGTILRWTSRP